MYQLLRRRFPVIAHVRQDASLPLLSGRHHLLTEIRIYKDCCGTLGPVGFSLPTLQQLLDHLCAKCFPSTKFLVLLVSHGWQSKFLPAQGQRCVLMSSSRLPASHFCACCCAVIAFGLLRTTGSIRNGRKWFSPPPSAYPCPQVAIDRQTSWHESCGKVKCD